MTKRVAIRTIKNKIKDIRRAVINGIAESDFCRLDVELGKLESDIVDTGVLTWADIVMIHEGF